MKKYICCDIYKIIGKKSTYPLIYNIANSLKN